MRRAGNQVGGRLARSARHQRRSRRNRPRGVAPSPSNLLARMPVRPSTTGTARLPPSNTPRLRSPGRTRIRIREKGRRGMKSGCHSTSTGLVQGQSPLALLPPNALLRATSAYRQGGSRAFEMTNTRKILIVDDDAELRDALVEQLALHEEFESIAVDTGAKGVQAAKAGQVDLVIMDVGLPDVDGREAVRILRKNGFKAPIIMLTGHNTDSDTILGLESGANDYVAKPF